MPRNRDQSRYITFHNEPSASSASEVVSIQNSFKLMDSSRHSKTIANPKPSKWQRIVFAIRRTLFCPSKQTSTTTSSSCSQPDGRSPSRSTFWCCCWCGSTPPPAFNTTAPETTVSSARFQTRSNSTPATTIAHPTNPPIVAYESRRVTMGGKYWKGDDSFRTNSDRFLETLEQDMQAERIMQRNRGKQQFKVSLLFRGIRFEELLIAIKKMWIKH